jgi:ketosteroid isomerase-like protein
MLVGMLFGSPIRRLAQLSALTLALSAIVTPVSRVAAAQRASSSAQPAHAADEARIRAIVAEQVTAWNAGDARTFSLHFAENGSFTNIQGAVFYGHRAFEDGGRTSPGVQARADGTIHTRLQQVFVRQNGDWSIAAYHNVDVKGP